MRKDRKSPLPFDWHVACEHLCRKDKKLARVIERVGPVQLEIDQLANTFEALAESIIYQQLTGKAAATIAGRFQEMFGDGKGSWPLPQILLDTPEDELRKAGLSRAKAAAIRDLARVHCLGDLPAVDVLHTMTDDEIIEKITAVKGVGPWTVHMLLIFRLGRPDVMPSTDYGVRKGFAATMKKTDLPTPKELSAHAERWRPYRSVGSWFMWRALEL